VNLDGSCDDRNFSASGQIASKAPEKRFEFGILPIQFPCFSVANGLRSGHSPKSGERATSEVVGYRQMLAMLIELEVSAWTNSRPQEIDKVAF